MLRERNIRLFYYRKLNFFWLFKAESLFEFVLKLFLVIYVIRVVIFWDYLVFGYCFLKFIDFIFKKKGVFYLIYYFILGNFN